MDRYCELCGHYEGRLTDEQWDLLHHHCFECTSFCEVCDEELVREESGS